MTTSDAPRDCKHGNLARSCEMCFLESELAEARTLIQHERDEHHETKAEPVADTNTPAEAIESASEFLREIVQRQPTVLYNHDVEAFILNVLNPALVVARRFHRHIQSMQKVVERYEALPAATQAKDEKAELEHQKLCAQDWFEKFMEIGGQLERERKAHAEAASFAVGMDHDNSGLLADIEALREELEAERKEREAAEKVVDENWVTHRRVIATRERAEAAEAKLAAADLIIEDAKSMLHKDAAAYMPTLPSAVAWCRNEIDMLRQKLAASEAREAALREELKVTDALLEERNKVLDAIPECDEHGSQCVPHALEWIAEAIAARKEPDK